MYKIRLLVAVFIALLAVVPASRAQEAGGTYRTALGSGCITGSIYTTCGHRVDAAVLQGLAQLRWDGNGLEPLMAESWEVQDGGESITLNLREGVTWHDGEAFNADDVVFTLNAYANPAVGALYGVRLSVVEGYDEFFNGEADSLAGVTKVDDYTVRLDMNQPAPLWMELDQIYLKMLPEHILGDVPAEEMNGHPFWTEQMIGTGPFMWESYEPEQFVELVRNEDYFKGAPLLERVIFQIYADVPAMLNAVESEEVDAIAFENGGIPLSELPRFQEMDHLNVISLDAGLSTFIALNLDDPRFADERVREAIAYALDRNAIIDSVMFGAPNRLDTMFPTEWAKPDDLETYSYDPQRARDLLAEAGWDSSQEIDFVYYYTDPVSADVIVTMQAYLADVGINITPRLVDGPTLLALRDDGTFEMGYLATGMGLDPSIGRLLITCAGGHFTLGYCDERVEELLDMGVSTADPEERAEYYQEISAILNDTLPKVWLWSQVRPVAVNERVWGPAEHYEEQPILYFDLPVYNEIETWYIKSE